LAWTLALALVLFAGCMTQILVYDEDQHITAGYLTRSLLPYRDFVYVQPPLYPYLLAAVFAPANGYYLLTARLLTFALSLAAFLLLHRILRRLGAGPVLSGVLAAACLASPFLLSASANARNDALPLVLFLAGLWSLLRADESRPGRFVLLAGLCAGAAVLAKLSYGFVPIVFLANAWLRGGRSWLWPCLLGCVLAAMPMLAFLAVAPGNTVYDVVRFHLTAPLAFYSAAGQVGSLGWQARLTTLAELLLLGGNAGLLGLAVVAPLLARLQRAKLPPHAVLLFALLAGALVFGFMPRPSWPMYYAAVAPILATLGACFAAHLRRGPMVPILGAAVLASALPFLSVRAVSVTGLADRTAWVGLATHDTANAIHAALAHPGPIATLFPATVLDANPTYRELATGPFLFRSAALLTPAEITALHGVGPNGLEALFVATPPAGIFTGLYAGAWTPAMDAELANYAARHAYRPVTLGGGVLWVRP
jgi:4-amino-4-deoxy-L-arabinose transferase-like glycosyltransferase